MKRVFVGVRIASTTPSFTDLDWLLRSYSNLIGYLVVTTTVGSKDVAVEYVRL